MSKSSPWSAPRSPRFTLLIAVAIILLGAGISALIPPSSALTNNGSITAFGTPLTENFDSLASSGTSFTWTDNSTIPGWYSSRTAYTVGTGSSNTGALYSFGVAGGNPVTDRALGSVGSGSTGIIYWGVKLTNNTGATITSLDVSYIGEQWRNGGATSPAVSVAQTVDFQYQIANAGVITGINTPTTGWVDHDPLDFTSPTFGTTAAATLDGNAGANRVAKSATLSITIASGQEVWLRWKDIDHTGNDHGLAVDDLSVTAHGAGPTNPTGVGAANPSSVLAGGTTLLTVNVTPGTSPISSGLAVTADLSSIGGSATQQFFDNATNGDVTAGDNIFSFNATVAAGTSGGAKTLNATVSDAQLRSSTAPISLTVLVPTPPSGIGAANPNPVQAGNSTLLTVNVTPGSNPTSTGIAVTGDLSLIGGSSTQTFYDDGTHGDATGGNNVFSFNATVSSGTSVGLKSLPIQITDAQSRTGSTSISLSVQAAPPPAGSVVISQVYGGGGNSLATYKNDFIEIFNRSTNAIDLTGWSVQYASAAGTSWQKTALTSIVLQPGQYYLVQEAAGAGGTTDLPSPDKIGGTIAMSATNAKVALVRDNNALSGGCPLADPELMDFVGYGTADCFEGAGAAPGLDNVTADFRSHLGCKDTDSNGGNFFTGAPNPRNTSTTATVCPVGDFEPEIFATSPASNEAHVAVDSNIIINFDEPVNVTGNWFQISCTSGLHTATVSGGPTSFTLNPDTDFTFNEPCTVTVFAAQVTDQDLIDPPDNLAADYVFSFNSEVFRDPAEHMVMGNPSSATTNVGDTTNFLMMKIQYALSYNDDRRIPNWTSWHLDSTWRGSAPRQDDFREDTSLPPGYHQVQETDYSGSGFDRGHMCPSADRTSTIPDNSATFLMTNMIPQAPGNNQGPWAAYENYLRTFLPGSEIYIISGGTGTGGVGSLGSANVLASGVTVPAVTWKVALIFPVDDGNDVARVDGNTRTIAVIMPNNTAIGPDQWQKYLATVDQVEALSGYDFYSNVPTSIQDVFEAKLDAANDTAPVANDGSATTAEDNSRTITLTASDFNVNNVLTFTVAGGPAHGSLGSVAPASCSNGNCTTTVTYTPASDYNGPDSFTFTVNDGALDSTGPGTVTINVTEVNDDPVAVNDAKTANQDGSLNFPASDLTANDTAGPGNESSQTLTVTNVISTPNTHGTVTLTSGTVSYMAEANYNGTASFDYQVCDNGTTNGSADPKCATGTVNVTVNDTTAPTISCPANKTVSCDASTDPSATGTATATDNRGTATVTYSDMTTPGSSAGNYTITRTWTATDANGNSSSCTQTITVQDTTPPAISCPTDKTVSCDASTDPSAMGTATATDSCSTATVTYSDVITPGSSAGNYTITRAWTATDASGNSSSCTQTITVRDTTAPAISCPTDKTVSCDASTDPSATGTATATDSCSTATVTYSDVTTPGSAAGNYTITRTWTATDASGNSSSCAQTITVRDTTAPTISCPANIVVAGNILGSCSANVNLGMPSATDSCSAVSVAGSRSDSQTLSAPYPLGTTTITWTATDATGNHSSCQQTVIVTNPSPVVIITGPPSGAIYAVNTPVTFTGSFTDNSGGTHTAQWTFDGITQAGMVNESTGEVTATYSFTSAGVYLVTLTVSDGCGGVGTADTVGGFTAMVVIYDPNAGFVTGGGWIDSPMGAYKPDANLVGKANFGFVSKYQNGATAPTGNTEFQFKAGNLNFHSTSYEWLVIAGARAQYKGVGTINGSGNYAFILTAIDGQTSGGGGMDKFRMRIWDRNVGETNGLIYDNQMGAGINDDPTTMLGGGSIVIHK